MRRIFLLFFLIVLLFTRKTFVATFTEPENYNFKLGRYTTSGSLTWCDKESTPCSVPLIAISSSSTPTFTPTPTPTPSSSPSPTDQSLSSITSTDSLLPDVVSGSTISNPITISINLFEKASSSSRSVLPASSKSSLSTPRSKKEFLAEREINPSKMLIVLGFLIVVLSFGIFLKSFINKPK